jgi:hypothetical protein
MIKSRVWTGIERHVEKSNAYRFLMAKTEKNYWEDPDVDRRKILK